MKGTIKPIEGWGTVLDLSFSLQWNLQTYPTKQVSVSLCLSEERLVFCHGVLVDYLFCVCFVRQLEIRIRQTYDVRVHRNKMYMITLLKWRSYVALQLLALLGVLKGEIVRHVGEPDAVCLLTVFSLWEKGQQQIISVSEINLQTQTCTHKHIIVLTSLSSSPAFFAWAMFRHPSVSQPTPFIQFRSERYWFCGATESVTNQGKYFSIAFTIWIKG